MDSSMKRSISASSKRSKEKRPPPPRPERWRKPFSPSSSTEMSKRTKGRASAWARPSMRATKTWLKLEDSVALTSFTRGSLARAKRSIFSSKAIFSSPPIDRMGSESP